MSAYINFITDFPTRCNDLLKMFQQKARFENREVTLLLAVASAGLIIPRARLIEEGHPSADRDHFISAATAFIKEMEGCFKKSAFYDQKRHGWTFFKGEITKDSYPDKIAFMCKPISNEKTTKNIIKIMRNALAHGNIFLRGDSRIERLLFLSKVQGTAPIFECIEVTVKSFEFFLRQWLDFLSKLNMPCEISGGIDIFPEDYAA